MIENRNLRLFNSPIIATPPCLKSPDLPLGVWAYGVPPSHQFDKMTYFQCKFTNVYSIVSLVAPEPTAMRQGTESAQ